VRLHLGIRFSLLNCLCITTIISFGPNIFAQTLFNPKKLPSDWMSPPILRQRLLTLAGSGAMNCGRASQSSLAAADVTDCALQQFASKKKFYARYDEEGVDSEQTIGFAFDGETLYTVTWRMMGWTGKSILKTQECPLVTQTSCQPLISDERRCQHSKYPLYDIPERLAWCRVSYWVCRWGAASPVPIGKIFGYTVGNKLPEGS
jgi:hypothetical protein